MTTDHTSHTADYLMSTQSVLYAGKRLRSLLGQDRTKLEYAATQLELAGQRQEGGASSYRAFMFAELGGTPETNRAQRARTTEDVLATIVADLHVANVLMAAGQSMGETGGKADVPLLDDALARLEGATRTVERSVAAPLNEPGVPGRFGFAAPTVGPPEVVHSPDLPAAIANVRGRANDALKSLVNGAQGVATSVFDALKRLDQTQVVAALAKLGGQIEGLSGIGRLVAQGLRKLQGAIKALTDLLGSDALGRIKDRVEQVWKDVTGGKYLPEVLEWAFQVDKTRTVIETRLSQPQLQLEALDRGSEVLGLLVTRFDEDMALAKTLIGGVTFAAALLALTPLAGPGLALFAASAYVLILAAVLLIGMDYADSGVVLQRVRGVGEIVAGL